MSVAWGVCGLRANAAAGEPACAHVRDRASFSCKVRIGTASNPPDVIIMHLIKRYGVKQKLVDSQQ